MNKLTRNVPIAAIATIAAIAAIAVALGACSDRTPTATTEEEDGAPLTIMTRNVYLGGDIGPVMQVDFTDPIAVIQASAEVWGSVQENHFPERARAIADEIAAGQPELIGLQEVSRFVTLNGQFEPTGVLDFMDILEAELANRGLSYVPLAVQENTVVTLPLAIDFQTGQVTEYVNFTDRIALLARSDVSVSDVAQGNYATEFTLAPGVVLKRGWIRATVVQEGETRHFVNTHLEGQSLAPIQAGQTTELLGQVVAGLDGVVVIVGDLNSDAEAVQGAPSWTPTYDQLTEAGFADGWLQANPTPLGDGFTCCQASDLRNGSPDLDQRIDFVLVKDPARSVKGIEMHMTGEELSDRTGATQLWPSDHAGLVAQFTFRVTPPSGI